MRARHVQTHTQTCARRQHGCPHSHMGLPPSSHFPCAGFPVSTPCVNEERPAYAQSRRTHTICMQTCTHLRPQDAHRCVHAARACMRTHARTVPARKHTHAQCAHANKRAQSALKTRTYTPPQHTWKATRGSCCATAAPFPLLALSLPLLLGGPAGPSKYASGSSIMSTVYLSPKSSCTLSHTELNTLSLSVRRLPRINTPACTPAQHSKTVSTAGLSILVLRGSYHFQPHQTITRRVESNRCTQQIASRSTNQRSTACHCTQCLHWRWTAHAGSTHCCIGVAQLLQVLDLCDPERQGAKHPALLQPLDVCLVDAVVTCSNHTHASKPTLSKPLTCLQGLRLRGPLESPVWLAAPTTAERAAPAALQAACMAATVLLP